MFSSYDIVRTDLPTTVEPSTNQVGDTNKYEGKDNPGGGSYRAVRKEKKKEEEEKKKPTSKKDGHIDLVA